MTSTITITIGDQAENHVGMQKIGQIANSGFTLNHLRIVKKYFRKLKIPAKIYCLNQVLNKKNITADSNAYILIIPKGVNHFVDSNDLFKELVKLKWDSKALMYGRVVTKHARHNLCFGNTASKPNYVKGKGRVVSFDEVPLLRLLMDLIEGIMGNVVHNLVAEGNYYYDSSKCGIGYHGDSERKKVIGIRLGASLPLVYQWYICNKSIGPKMKFNLNDGDIYIMSEKAVGTDWKKSSLYTLRHAAGSDKYI